MSVLDNYPSTSDRDAAYPAASNIGRCIFRTDTKAIEVSDGTNYLTYNNDGITYDFSGSNTHSGEFDGGNDYIDIGTLSELNTSGDYSVSTWVKFEATTLSLETIYGAGTATSARAWVIIIDSTTIRFGSGSAVDDFSPSSALTNGQWYHFVFTVNGTTGEVFLDGSSLGTATVNASASTAFNDFRIGGLSGGGGFGSTVNPIQGKMDEFAVYNRAITSTEVSNIYDNKIYVGPTAMYRLDGDVTDETGNYDGTNNGVTFSTTDKPY